MHEAKRIAQLYKSVYEGDENGEAWHALALKPLLKDITAEQASRAPKVGSHSIFQLVRHIAYWEEVVLRRFQGEIVDAPLNTPEDWPPQRGVNAAEWQAALARLDKSHAALLKAMEGATEEKLAKHVPGKNHDYYTLLHGIIDHAIYHSAQIAMLKKVS